MPSGHRSLRAWAVSTLLALTAVPALATDLHNVLADYSVTSWSKKDGLPSGTIWALAQDNDGYLWIGADFGLVRFDGVRFVPWDSNGHAPLPQAAVQSLRVSRDGTLWVGFGGEGGLSRISHGQVRTYGPADGLTARSVTAIVEDRAGTLLAVSGGVLYRLTGERWTPWKVAEGQIRTAYVGPTGDLFVVTAGTVLRRRQGSDVFEPFAHLDNGQAVAEDARGRTWATDRLVGFRRLGDSTVKGRAIESGRGITLLADREDNLWVATWGQGVWRVQTDARTQSQSIELATDLTGLSNNVSYSLLEDREGNIWVGTNEGLNRLTAHKFTQLSDLGLVTGLDTSGDRVWAGTANGVANLVLRDGTWAVAARYLEGLATSAMYGDDKGVLWVATDRGLERLAVVGSRVAASHVTSDLRAITGIASDGRGGLWLYDAERGLVRWSHGRIEAASLPEALRGSRFGTTFTDHSGRTFVGFAQGELAVIDHDGGLRVYGPRDGLDTGFSRAIYEDEAGTIWIVGGRGLARFSNGQFLTLRQGNGLLANLTGVVEDEAGNLWMGGANGIVRMNRSDFERAAAGRWDQVIYQQYDTADGVAGTTGWIGQRSSLRTRDGRLWFLTVRGVTIVDPRLLHSTHGPSPTRIEEVVVNDRRIDPSAGIRLSAKANRLEINYTVPDLTSTLKTRFRYRLEGLDTDWTDAGTRRQAVYANLRPGTYAFRVQANNEDGNWARPAAVWDFSIAPAVYQRPSSYVLLMAVLGALVWAAWRLRMSQVRNQFALLLGERVRLSREIHDTLLQSLVGVSLQLDQLGSDLQAAPTANRAQVTRIRKQVEEYIREARQSIWNLRSSTLQRHDLAAALRQSGERAVESAVAFDFKVTGTPHRCAPAVEEQVLRIGQEAITNVLRHSQAQRIQMELKYDPEVVTLRVADDGCGFDPATVGGKTPEGGTSHWGVMSMRERAETIGGIFRISSATGAGTIVETVVPVGQA